MIGVCCTGSGDGTDPYAEISLQPLPDYTIPSDGVTMTCIACTEKGHIFLAGRDGHIYEMQYTTGSSWRKRCRKICLTTGLSSLVSRFVHDLRISLFFVNGLTQLLICGCMTFCV